MATIGDRLDGRYGFPDGCSEWGYGKWIAYVFNRCVLGYSVLLGFYLLALVDWSRPLAGEPWWGFIGVTPLGNAVLIFLVVIPGYFRLHKRLDAPGRP